MKLPGGRVLTSHVGSVPLPHSLENARRAFEDMVRAGVDAPPYPQMRSFVDMYLEPLAEAGLLERSGARFVPKGGVRALLDADPPEPEVPPEARVALQLAGRLGVRLLRAPVTGPFTLAAMVSKDGKPVLEHSLLTVKEAVTGFLTGYVAGLVKRFAEAGYGVVVVDDPMLSNIVGRRVTLFGYTDDDIVAVYETALSRAGDALKGVHVCGLLSPRVPELLASVPSLDFLNHEFKESPRNLELGWKPLLEKHGKFLAPGVLSSRRPVVESVGETLDLLRKIASRAGHENINLVSADCGFAALATGGREEAYDVAVRKWRVLARAVARFSSEVAGRGG